MIYFACIAVFCTFPDDFGKLPYHVSSSTASRWWITNYLSWTETHVIHKSLPVKLIISWLRCASKIAFDLCGSRGSWAWCGDAWKCLVIRENMEGDVELGGSSLGWDFQKQTKIWRVKDNLVVLFHLAIELVDPGHWYFYRRTWISIVQGWSYIPTEAANQHNKT